MNRKGLLTHERAEKPAYAAVRRWNRDGLSREELESLVAAARGPRFRPDPAALAATALWLAAALLLAARRPRPLDALIAPFRREGADGTIGAAILLAGAGGGALLLGRLVHEHPLHLGFLGDAGARRLGALLGDPVGRLALAHGAVLWWAALAGIPAARAMEDVMRRALLLAQATLARPLAALLLALVPAVPPAPVLAAALLVELWLGARALRAAGLAWAPAVAAVVIPPVLGWGLLLGLLERWYGLTDLLPLT